VKITINITEVAENSPNLAGLATTMLSAEPGQTSKLL
jgi:hypothetical protein